MGIFQQFPYSNFHEMNMDWFLKEFKSLLAEWATWEDWKAEVDNFMEYMKHLDLSQEVSDKIDEMYEDGTLQDIIQSFVTEPYSFKASKFAVLDNAAFQGSYYSTNPKALQSSCYNSKLQRFLLVYSDMDDPSDDGLLVELDSDFNFIRRELISAGFIGHGNDITYDSKRDTYIVATMENGGVLGFIDPATLAGTALETVSGVDEICQIAYNPVLDNFFITDTLYNIYTVSADLANVQLINTITADMLPVPYDNITMRYLQGSAVYNGKFVIGYWLGGSSLSYDRLMFINAAGDAEYFIDTISPSIATELEGVMYDGKYIYHDLFPGRLPHHPAGT